jgi:TolB protein
MKKKSLLFFFSLGWALFIAGEALGQERLYFSSNHSGNWELWSIRPDGGDLKQLTRTAEDEHSPAVSPDGKEILFVDGRRTLWIMKTDGSDRKEIPLPKGIYAQPTWSPDGREIAFVKYMVLPEDRSEIWRMRREGDRWGEPKRLSPFPPMRLFPCYAPDGSKLLFTEFRRDERLGAIEEIGVFDFAQKAFKLITHDRADSFKGVWSPTGDEIAYTSNKSGNYDVWVISLKDGRQRQLTRDPVYDGEPTWSPDGREIAFVSTRSGSKELWVMSATGDLPRQLTKTGKACKEPFWGK